MSGGSFDYLCHKQLVPDAYLIGYMLEELEKHYPNSKATADTRAVVEWIESLNKEPMLSLREGVWRAVEWERSCDYGRDQVDEYVERYERGETGL